MKIIKKVLAIIIIMLLMFTSYVIVSVHYWSITNEGRLPAKTAVILYAINKRIITSDTNPPKFITKARPATIVREDILIPVSEGKQIPARVYYPKNGGSHPLILYYHGGAFMEGYGNIETHDNIVRALARRTESVVMAVGYRVAPTYIFPTAVEDSYDALLWAYENAPRFNGDPKRIAVAGDSAGGNIATAITLMTRDLSGPRLVGQALLYPLTTFQDIPLPSRMTYDSGYYLLSRNVMRRARELYTPKEDMWLSPYTSPLNAENLRNLPPTLIITAEFDPLRDEGEKYGQRLADFGVPVLHLHYEGVMHGFVSFYEVMKQGEHGLRETVSFFRRAFSEDQQLPQGYEKTIIKSPHGKERIRENVEAYVMAAFLIYLEMTS